MAHAALLHQRSPPRGSCSHCHGAWASPAVQLAEVVAPTASTAAIPIGTPRGPEMPETPTAPTKFLPLNMGRPPVSNTHGVESSDVRAVPFVTLAADSKFTVSV